MTTETLGTWGDASVSQLLAVRARGPEFDSHSDTYKTFGMVADAENPNTGEAEIFGPVRTDGQLAEPSGSQVSVRGHISKFRMNSCRGTMPEVVLWPLRVCAHTFMCVSAIY